MSKKCDHLEYPYFATEPNAHDGDRVGWKPIETAPANIAVLVRGGDVLYPTTMSTCNHDGWIIDSQGRVHDRDVKYFPTQWIGLDELERLLDDPDDST